jgi:hypothetical protein
MAYDALARVVQELAQTNPKVWEADWLGGLSADERARKVDPNLVN